MATFAVQWQRVQSCLCSARGSSPAPLSLPLEGADSQSPFLSRGQGAGHGCELSPHLPCCVGSKEFAKPGRACDTQLMTFSLPVFPLRQKSECLLSLEAYSQEQKKRICWCLAENITKQQHPAAAPTEGKVRDPLGSWKFLPGSACVGLCSVVLGGLCRRLLVCQVSREFGFRHCCVCSSLPCPGSSGCVCVPWLG